MIGSPPPGLTVKMPGVEVNTGSLEPSDGETSIPSSKRQKTENAATQDECDSSELPEKEKSDDAEQQNGTDFPTPHSNQSSQRESIGNESPAVSKFKEDNGQHNEKNCIVPANRPELENELSLFYKELEKLENDTDLLVDGSTESKENAAVDKHRKNKTGSGRKKIADVKHKAENIGDPCIDTRFLCYSTSQIPANAHPCSVHWNNVMSLSRPQWNQPQAFIGPQGPPLPRLNIPFAYQRYSAPPRGPMPFPHDRGLLNNCNIPPFTAKNESCIVQAYPVNDCPIQPGHKYFCNYGPRENTTGQPIMLKPSRTNLCQQYQQAEKHSRPGVGDKVLIFMRGPPGSGKSTLSRLLLAQSPNGVVLSTDDYFCQNGVYWFDPSFLGEAHDWNQNRGSTHSRYYLLKHFLLKGRAEMLANITRVWESFDDGEKLKSLTKQSMDEGRTPIIIDNTNIQAWEMKPYAEMAVERCYRVSFREPETWWKFNVVELEKRNKHRVPREKIIQMMERFEHPMSSDIVLSSVEPSRSNKILLNLPAHYSQSLESKNTATFLEVENVSNISSKFGQLTWEGKVKKKPKVLPPLNKRTKRNTKHKKKRRPHRKVKASQNQISEITAESHWPGGSQEQHTSECEDDLSNEEHSDAEDIIVTDLVSTLRDSQDSIGAPVEKILNCKRFDDKDEVFSIEENVFVSIYEPVGTGDFKMADVLSVESYDIHINLLEDYDRITNEDFSDVENSLLLSDSHQELDQSHDSLVKNYISVTDTAADKANLVILPQKYFICISKKTITDAVQYQSAIGSTFKEALVYVEGQERVKTLVLEDDADDYKRKEEANLNWNRNFLTNLLEEKKIASWGCCDWPVDNKYRPCEQRQKRDCRFRHRDASVNKKNENNKNQAEKLLHKETAQQNPLASSAFCQSSTENISQGNDYVLQLCPQGNSSTAQCVANQFASSNILSETTDGTKETKSFCIGKSVNETGKEATLILQDSFYNPPLVKINYRRKSKRFYRLAPTFQLPREIPVDSKGSRRKELLTEIKPMNCISTDDIFQREVTSLNLSMKENIGTCQGKLEQIAVEGSQFVNRFCETIKLSKIINNEVKKEGSQEDNVPKQGLDGSSSVESLHTLKHETMHNNVLPGPSHETDSMKKEGNLSQFDEQYGASLCNPCVGYELAEKSMQDDEQDLLMFPEKCPFLEMQLSLEFALQLVELFGSPGIDPDFLLPEDCKVHLDKQITKMIHSQWKKSVEERLKQISLMGPNTFKGGMTFYNIQDINGEIHQEPDHEAEEKSSAVLDSYPDTDLSSEEDLKPTGNDDLVALSSDTQLHTA